jgi:tRNA modification GTPase
MTSSAGATVVVELTPPGRAAVAVVVVDGPDALRAVGHCFIAQSGRAVGDIPIGRIVLGRWGGPDGEELVLCRRDDQQIEVHCHGGTAAVASVIERLVCLGCQRIGWQEWHTSRTPDPLQAAAQIALAAAVTERTAAILLDQWNGALSTAIRGIIADIAAAQWFAATEKLEELLSQRELGLHLINPWRVVVFGAPNVGKSSLINALAGYERAIVSPTPGTTRDVVTVTTAIEGWPVQFSDTAGFRETQDELESAGIELATTTLSKAELAIIVHDATKLRDETSGNETKLELPPLAPHVRAIHIINKIDLVSAEERLQVVRRFVSSQPGGGQPHLVSALNGEGVADLMPAIARSLVPVSLAAGLAVPFTAEQVDGLAAAKAAVERRDTTAASELLHALLTPMSF